MKNGVVKEKYRKLGGTVKEGRVQTLLSFCSSETLFLKWGLKKASLFWFPTKNEQKGTLTKTYKACFQEVRKLN